MPHFVQSFETGRWCIEHQGYDIEEGMVVAFPNIDAAAHFVEQNRAGYIGEFPSMDMAFERLAEIIETQKAAEAAAAEANAGAGGEPVPAGDGAAESAAVPAEPATAPQSPEPARRRSARTA